MLANLRSRLLLVVLVWIATLLALLLWLGGRSEQVIMVGAGKAHSESFQLMTAIADVVNDMNRGFQLSVFETGGTIENMALLEQGQFDMATAQADAVLPEEALGVAVLYADAYHLVVNGPAGIKQVSDLRGKSVGIPPVSSAQETSFWLLMEHYGLGEDEIDALPMAASAANFALEQAQIDAVFRVRAPGNRPIRELIGDQAMELVPIHQAAALSLNQPALSAGFIPQGSYRGHPTLPADDLPTAVVNRLLVSTKDLPATLVYAFTRSIFEARSEIASRMPLAGFIEPLHDDARSPLATHPGARQYYEREKPGVLQENARLFSGLLYALVILFSAGLALRSRWKNAHRVRMGEFNQRLLGIAHQARAAKDEPQLHELKNQLMAMLAEVVRGLDEEKINQSEFEHFSFTWQAVDALVRDQMLLSKNSHRVVGPAGGNG
ncbi:MAG: TAXI family TRAP transporter solute-binding subunit [Halioglobus sp.]|nr:TAXI family TRAP transporter solute-binding subunit [Halioglobus sp.]